MDILNETLISLSEATRELPGRPHVATIQRWMRQGIHGHLLEFVYCGGRRYTSKEAIQRFLAAQNCRSRNPSNGGFSNPNKRGDARASQELDRLGL